MFAAVLLGALLDHMSRPLSPAPGFRSFSAAELAADPGRKCYGDKPLGPVAQAYYRLRGHFLAERLRRHPDQVGQLLAVGVRECGGRGEGFSCTHYPLGVTIVCQQTPPGLNGNPEAEWRVAEVRATPLAEIAAMLLPRSWWGR
jgi:hypothetical protein